ncbi:MAG: hypothetical protein M5U12_08145 [Verrucomicrobia bacterium]|nr:hypothetical protein [Verrucomicrobiota bacterium]
MNAATNPLLRRAAFAGVTALALALTLSARADAPKTCFTGVEENYTHDPGQWFGDGVNIFVFRRACVADENISDPRLKGRGSFTYTVDATAGLFWGRGRIVPDQGGGEWVGCFTATMSPGTTIQMTLTGSGDYAGLVARLTYTPGAKPDTLAIEGYIVEAKGGPGDRPLKVRACRTEQLQMLPCLELDPTTWPPIPYEPPRPAAILKALITSETGQITHVGRLSNQGLSLVDPVTGLITGTGTAKAANGDEVFWVFEGAHDPAGVPVGSVHFCGGTGRFEAAVGGFDLEVTQGPEPAEDPWVLELCYVGSGTVRY